MSVYRRLCARAFPILLCMAFATSLLGASAPALLAGTPVIVVFPFKVADGLDPVNGRIMATAIASAVSAQGGVKIVIGDPATAPTDFLHVTAENGGDYYLTGFISAPVGASTSVLEQLVSKRSGTAIWGSTASINSDADIAAQGPIIHDAVLSHATRGYFSIVNGIPTPTPKETAAPKKKNGFTGSGSAPGPAQTPRRTLDLPNEAYGFSSAPTAPPKVYASAAHPTRFAILAVTGNTVTDQMRQYALTSLVTTLAHHGQPAAQGDPDTTKHFLMHPQDICKSTGSAFLVFGTIAAHSTDATNGAEPWTNADYTPMVYDCTAQAYNRSGRPIRGEAFDWKTAIDRATLKATTDFFAKLPHAATASHA